MGYCIPEMHIMIAMGIATIVAAIVMFPLMIAYANTNNPTESNRYVNPRGLINKLDLL